jgi:hypothetical protein
VGVSDKNLAGGMFGGSLDLSVLAPPKSLPVRVQKAHEVLRADVQHPHDHARRVKSLGIIEHRTRVET